MPDWGWSPWRCTALQVRLHVCLSIAALCPGLVLLRGATVCSTTFWMHPHYGLRMASGNQAVPDQSARYLPVWLSWSGEYQYFHGVEQRWCMSQVQSGQSLPATMQRRVSVPAVRELPITTRMPSRSTLMSCQESKRTVHHNHSQALRRCQQRDPALLPLASVASPCTRRLPTGEKTSRARTSVGQISVPDRGRDQRCIVV